MNPDKKIRQYVVFFSIFYIILNAICTVNEFYWLNLLPLGLLLFYLLIFHFETYLIILLLVLPVSVPLSSLNKNLSFDISLPVEVLIVFAALFFVLKVAKENRFDKKIIFHPVTIAILFNISWIFITCFTSTMPIVSFKFLASRIWFVIVFYFILLLFFLKYKNFYTYFWCFAIPFIFVVLYFIYSLYTKGSSTLERTANWVSKPFFPDHTSYAAAIAMMIPVFAVIIYIKKKANSLQKLFFWGMLIFFIIALVLSYTRAAWFSLIVALGFMVAFLFQFRFRTTLLFTVLATIIISVSWTQIQMSLSKNKQNSSANLVQHVKSVSNISTDASNLERINRWNSAIRMFKEKPIFGFGPGTYMFKYAPFQATKDRTTISTDFGDLGNAHSEYLGPLSESGILGSLSFIAIVLTSIFTASRIFFTAKRRKIKYLALALAIGLLSYDIHGMMNDFLDLEKLNGLFWGFTAMIVALDIYHNRTKETRISIFNY